MDWAGVLLDIGIKNLGNKLLVIHCLCAVTNLFYKDSTTLE